MVQTGHACLEAGFSFERPASTSFLILLQIENQEELLNVSKYLNENEIEHETFFEPDYDMGYTSICTKPIYGKERNLFKKFKLWSL